MKKIIVAIILVVVALCTSCGTITFKNEEELSTWLESNGYVREDSEEVSVEEKVEKKETKKSKKEKKETSTEESYIEYKHEDNLCVKLVKAFSNEGYYFRCVDEDIKAVDIVNVWKATDGKLTLKFEDYALGLKRKECEVIILRLETQEMADALADFLMWKYAEQEIRDDMLLENRARSFEDAVVVITNAETMERVVEYANK